MSAITHHAAARGKERFGLKTKSVERMAEIALDRGITIEDTAGALRRHLDHARVKHGDRHLRIYGEMVFVFADRVMITCWPLPRLFRKTLSKIREEKKAA